ncbi:MULTISPECIES: zinc-binding dehydrogenase [Rhodomicrobium]|uniref:zinc-binding dehydrogenase n=1 Tax=Rhodomicrobium TaxID=1068 RepID=UPI000B4B9D92|nr:MULTISPECIES: zinc-binding dehydrogenase [Rhodomicrobium]
MAHAIRLYEHGEPSVLTWESVDVGEPGLGEVRLRQRAIGLNFVDTMFRDGTFPLDLPAVLGIEGSGTVEAVGAGTEFEIGDRVAYFYAPGSYATRRIVPVAPLVRLPDDISEDQAVTFLGKGLTAWMGLRLLHQLEAGQTILVQGATGATGTIVSLWAKALGARVIGTTGSPEKLETLAAVTDHAILTGDETFDVKLKALAPDGVDAVYEFVGKATIARSVGALRDGGRLLTIGAASGTAELDEALIATRRISVAGGSTVRNVRGELIGQAVGELFDAVRAGAFSRIQATRYPLRAAAQAHEDVRARRLTGPSYFVASE